MGLVVTTALSGAMCLPLAAQAQVDQQQNATSAATAPAAGQNAASQPAGDQSAANGANAPSGNAATGAAVASNPDDELQPIGKPPREGFWGRVNPFARKKYVNNQLTPIRDRINELDDLSKQNAQQIRDLDARSQAAIAQAQGQADKANQIASAAQQAVQQDAAQAGELNQRYDATNRTIQGVDQYQVAQTAVLQFNRGRATLDDAAQQQLSTFLQGLDTQKGYVVEVTAYSPLRGQAGMDNSQQLADAVVRYLVLQSNIPLYRIYTMGMGNAAAPAAAGTYGAESNGAAGENGATASNMTPATQPGVSSVTRSTPGGTVEIKILRDSLGSEAAGGQE